MKELYILNYFDNSSIRDSAAVRKDIRSIMVTDCTDLCRILSSDRCWYTSRGILLKQKRAA